MKNVILSAALVLCFMLSGVSNADDIGDDNNVFFIYNESECTIPRFKYASIEDYFERSKATIGDDFQIIEQPKKLENIDGRIVFVKLIAKGKEYLPIVFEGTRESCERLVSDTKSANAEHDEQNVDEEYGQDDSATDPIKGGIYWAAPLDAIANGTYRCQHFDTPTLEEQKNRLIKKYGDDLKIAKIIDKSDGSHALVVARYDSKSGIYVKYAYFDSIEACEDFQSAVFQERGANQNITSEGVSSEKQNGETWKTVIGDIES